MKKPLFITLASIIVVGLFGAAVVGVDHHFYPGSNDSSSSTEGPGTGGGTDGPTENVVLPDVAACYGKRNVIHSVTFELTANDTMKAGYAAQVKKGDTTAYALVYTLHTAVVGCDSFDFYVGIEDGKVAAFGVGELLVGHNIAYPIVTDNKNVWIGYPSVSNMDVFAGSTRTADDMRSTIDKALADSATRDAEAILKGAQA